MFEDIYYDSICIPIVFVLLVSVDTVDIMDNPVKSTDVIILDSMEIRNIDASNPS